jgi:hypothetical protein
MESHEANLETPDKTATNNTSADPGGDLAESSSAPDQEPASDHADRTPPINGSATPPPSKSAPTGPDAASNAHVARVPTYPTNWCGISGILYVEP